MPREAELLDIAEGYLGEMLAAEQARDFAAWRFRWDDADLRGLTEAQFLSDLDNMMNTLGRYQSRAYFGVVQGTDQTGPRYRFVWKARFEKSEALIVVGLRHSHGVWCPCENACSH